MKIIITLFMLLIILGGCSKKNENEKPATGDSMEKSHENNDDKFYKNINPIKNPDSYLVLVNKNNVLESSYVPKDLVVPNITSVNYTIDAELMLRQTAAEMIEQLFQAALDEDGLILLALSGYRSYEYQKKIYEGYVETYGQYNADRFSARPGHSEHQTGLAIDVTSESADKKLIPEFGNTKEGIWIQENAHRFGFIIRYPLDREKDTGYTYEPWHLRYVGKVVAAEMFEKKMILEDYLQNP